MPRSQSIVRATACARCSTPLTSIQMKRRGRYCSLRCASQATATITPPQARFWRFVQQGDGCWEWTGHRALKGYGLITRDHRGGLRTAHRLSWEIHYGPIPAGLCVCHRCDNPPCVRPDHLFLGTAGENSLDMWAKGRGKPIVFDPARHRRGEDAPSAKLTEDNVRLIRQMYAEGNISQSALGRRFGITQGAVWLIVSRQRWAHVD